MSTEENTNEERPEPTNRDDWPTTVQNFRTIFAGRTTRKPVPRLSGRNFVTDEFLGNVRTASGEIAEVSTGWFAMPRNESRLFGVTYGPDEAGRSDDRSQCCHSWREVIAALGLDPCEYGAPTAARCQRIADHEGDHLPDEDPFPARSDGYCG